MVASVLTLRDRNVSESENFLNLHKLIIFYPIRGRFDIDDQNFVNIPLMHLEAYLPVIRKTNYDTVGLPYQEENLVMYVILPKYPGMEELRKVLYSFSPTDVKSFSASAIPQRTSIVLPKFKLTARFSLKQALAKQGMNTSFSPEQGNFINFFQNEVNRAFPESLANQHSLFSYTSLYRTTTCIYPIYTTASISR